MSNLLQSAGYQDHGTSTGQSPAILRQPLVQVLFIQSNLANVERCLRGFRNGQFRVDADVALTPEQFTQRLDSKCYDVVLAEYPSPNWQETRALDLLRQMSRHIPLIFLIQTMDPETAAELIAKGADDCVEMENVGHLPIVIRRILSERKLREQRDRAKKKLRYSEARYRALVGNLAYGICRWSMEGKFLDANQALVTMLGYTSRKELMAEDLTGALVRDPSTRKQILQSSGPENPTQPLEIGWKRRDGATLKVRLSGREVQGGQGKIAGYEIIVQDVTNQRELEDSLRDQAARDPLTGLANYRHLIDVLDGEIKRCTRTGRQFALLLFDLDHLKQINDRYGHVTGSRALCRLADTLCVSCRDIDTAARFGGDEFALVLPETELEPARLVAQRICRSLVADGRHPKVSVSAGAAIYPRDGQTIESLLSAADVALYAMKSKHNTHGRSSGSFTNRLAP
jgi:diguanylate cyclase (GGDEF)-like protein/PAS domain S-box-containing protein